MELVEELVFFSDGNDALVDLEKRALKFVIPPAVVDLPDWLEERALEFDLPPTANPIRRPDPEKNFQGGVWKKCFHLRKSLHTQLFLLYLLYLQTFPLVKAESVEHSEQHPCLDQPIACQ